jgi:peptidyl-prolyl cis-trans isomerase C
MPNIVKPLIRFAFFGVLFLSAVFGFPQGATKTPAAKPKAGAPEPASASTPQSKPADTAKASDDEAIPPAEPNALFPALVARVNGKPILGRDLERIVRRQLAPIGNPEWKNLREDYQGQLVYDGLSTLINSKLILLKATASGIKVTDAEVQAEFQKFGKTFNNDAEMNLALANQQMDRASLEKDLYESLLLAKYVDENITKKIVVTNEEVSKYYTEHTKEFQHPDLVRTSHILIKAGDTPEQDAAAKQRAEALLARIKKGEDFAKLAKENSVDSSASQGGDIGFATKDNLAPEYSEAAFSLPVGGMKVVKSQYGYHVIKVTEKKKEGLSTLDEIRQDLTEFLKNEKGQTDLAKIVNQLRDQAKIEILIPAGQPLKP